MSVWPREANAPETLEDFDAWADDLRGHRAAYRESSFRWDHNDVLTLISWATGGRLEFTTTDDLRFLEHARARLRDEMRAARMDTAPHIARAAAAGGSAETARSLGMPQATVERLAAPHDPKEHQPSTFVHRATVGLHDNPLVHAWEAHQAWMMVTAAFQVVDDTITTVVWELHHDADHSVAGLAAASAMTENQIRTRIHRRDREVRAATAMDPRRPTPIPRQTYPGTSNAAGPARPARELHAGR